MAEIPSLSELCAKSMLETGNLDEDEQLAVLEKLRADSKSRTKVLEKELRSPGERAETHRSGRNERLFKLDLNSPSLAQKKLRGMSSFQAELNELNETKSHRERIARDVNQQMEDEEEDTFDRDLDEVDAMKYKQAAEEAKQRRRELKQSFEWKQRYTQLAHKVQVLDRERMAVLRMSKDDLEAESAELEKFDADLSRHRKIEQRNLDNQIDKCKWAVKRLAATIAEMGSGEAYVKSVKQQIADVEAAISLFRSTERPAFEDLLNREERFSSELDHLREKFEQEEEEDKAAKRVVLETRRTKPASPRVASLARGPGTVSSQASDDIKSHIEEIDEAIASMGGANGNWDERDHVAFLRCVSRVKVPDSVFTQLSENGSEDFLENSLITKLLSKCTFEIPTKDEDTILAHIEWYGKYLSLLNEKKDCVRAWKTAKQSTTPRVNISNKEQADPNTKGAPALSKEERQKRERLRKEEEDARRRSVQEWRASKAAEKKREALAKEAEERVEKEKRAVREEERRKEKEQIALFKLEREAEMERQKRFKETISQEAQSSDQTSTISLKERRKRDLQLTAQKRMSIEVKSKEREDRAAQIAKIKAKPAVRAEFSDQLRHRSGVAVLQQTTAFKSKSLTPEELGEIQERRSRTRAHESVVPSSAGYAMGGRSYGIGVRGMVSGRAPASWKASR